MEVNFAEIAIAKKTKAIILIAQYYGYLLKHFF